VARVLVVEDEERYREVVCRYLAREGHEVAGTADAGQAVALGLAHPPEVLVADWMLRNSLHGLHVAEALRVADPGLRTVVVTGFPASDVTVDAEKIGIAEILEKPFDVEALEGAIRRAAASRGAAREARDEEVVGFLHVAPDGVIARCNDAGRALLGEGADDAAPTADGAGRPTLEAVFPQPAALPGPDDGWRRVPVRAGAERWVATRVLADGAGTVLLTCAVSQEWRRGDPRARMLLGRPRGPGREGAFRDAMLLVDDAASVRDTFVAQLAHRGCPARAAGKHDEAIEIFRSDPRIRVVVLDWAMPGEDLRATVARLREIRPETRLVGTSGEDRSAEFAELGIDDFLLKPWTVSGELASLLSEDVPSPGNGWETPSR